jgi:hypothetical protein
MTEKDFLPQSKGGSEMRDERYVKQHVIVRGSRKRFSILSEKAN